MVRQGINASHAWFRCKLNHGKDGNGRSDTYDAIKLSQVACRQGITVKGPDIFIGVDNILQPQPGDIARNSTTP